MGWFSDKCQALVDVASGRALQGEELAAAEKLLWGIDAKTGERTRLSPSDPGTVQALAARGWGFCGHDVSKKARICSKCGSRAPGGWIKCPSCKKWIGAESHFCPHCNHRMHLENRVNLAGGVWERDANVFAERFDCGETLAHLGNSGLYVQEGTKAVLLDGGRLAGVLGPGRHTPEGLARAINWFGNPPPRSVVMVDSGDAIVKLAFPLDGAPAMRTKDGMPVKVVADATIRLVPSRVDEFLENFMKDARSVRLSEIADATVREAAAGATAFCASVTAEDMLKDPRAREKLEEATEESVKAFFKRAGLELVRVGCADFICAAYEELRGKHAELDGRRREIEFERAAMKLAAEREADLLDRRGQKLDAVDAAKRRDLEREKEYDEYVERLAADKLVASEERRSETEKAKIAAGREIDLARKVASGELSAKDAELERARRLEGYARDLEDQAHALEMDLNLREFNRAQAVSDAENAAKLAGVARRERVEEAKNAVEIKGFEVQIAEKEAQISKIKTDAETYRMKAISDAERHEDMNDLDVLARKNEIESDSRKAKADAVKDKTNIELMALAATDAEREMYMKLALAEMQIKAQADLLAGKKGMSAEQLLALAAADKPEVAKALADMAAAGKNESALVLREMKEMLDKREKHDSAMMQEVSRIVTEAVKNHDTVVQAPAAQVFNK